jgi:hypothetical protein
MVGDFEVGKNVPSVAIDKAKETLNKTRVVNQFNFINVCAKWSMSKTVHRRDAMYETFNRRQCQRCLL